MSFQVFSATSLDGLMAWWHFFNDIFCDFGAHFVSISGSFDLVVTFLKVVVELLQLFALQLFWPQQLLFRMQHCTLHWALFSTSLYNFTTFQLYNFSTSPNQTKIWLMQLFVLYFTFIVQYCMHTTWTLLTTLHCIQFFQHLLQCSSLYCTLSFTHS